MLTAGILAGAALLAASVLVGPLELVGMAAGAFSWALSFGYKAFLAIFVSVVVSIIVLVVSAAALAAILLVIRGAGSVR
jgi:hypothetical protein